MKRLIYKHTHLYNTINKKIKIFSKDKINYTLTQLNQNINTTPTPSLYNTKYKTNKPIS